MCQLERQVIFQCSVLLWFLLCDWSRWAGSWNTWWRSWGRSLEASSWWWRRGHLEYLAALHPLHWKTCGGGRRVYRWVCECGHQVWTMVFVEYWEKDCQGHIERGTEPAAGVGFESAADCLINPPPDKQSHQSSKLWLFLFLFVRSPTRKHSSHPVCCSSEVCGGTMVSFFPLPGKKEDKKQSKHQAALMSWRHLWRVTHSLLHNVTIMNSPNRLQGFCVDGGPGCVCSGKIGLCKCPSTSWCVQSLIWAIKTHLKSFCLYLTVTPTI